MNVKKYFGYKSPNKEFNIKYIVKNAQEILTDDRDPYNVKTMI